MAIKIKKHKGLTTSYNIDRFKTTKAFFNKHINTIVFEAMIDIQRRAVLQMARAYLRGKKDRTYMHKKYNGRPNEKMIEHAIFGGSAEAARSGLAQEGAGAARGILSGIGISAPQKKGKGKYTIKVFPENLSAIKRRIPHFIWVDEGVRRNIDRQPYLDAKKLPAGEKWVPLKRSDEGKYPKEQIKQVRVPHKKIQRRQFVLAAQTVLKRKQPINTFIRKRIAAMLRAKGVK